MTIGERGRESEARGGPKDEEIQVSELHVRQIKAALEQHFDGQIDMSDYVTKPHEEQQRAFLSRAQGAFVLTYLTG